MQPGPGKSKPGYVNKAAYPSAPCADIYTSTGMTDLAVSNPKAKDEAKARLFLLRSWNRLFFCVGRFPEEALRGLFRSWSGKDWRYREKLSAAPCRRNCQSEVTAAG